MHLCSPCNRRTINFYDDDDDDDDDDRQTDRQTDHATRSVTGNASTCVGLLHSTAMRPKNNTLNDNKNRFIAIIQVNLC